MRRLPGFALLIALSACSGSLPQPTAPAPSPSLGIAGAVPPISKDAPIAFGAPIVPPSEPREAPLGKLAFLIDSGSQSAYEYDFGRGRFIGPARLVNDGHHVIAMPGYPTVLSDQPVQHGTIAGDRLVVAGGIDGTVIVVPITPEGLGKPARLLVPVVQVQEEPLYGGRSVANGERLTGRPEVDHIAAIDETRIVAVTSSQSNGTSVAYLVDAHSMKVTKSTQLPFGQTDHILAAGDTFVAVTNEGELLILDFDLQVRHTFKIQGLASGGGPGGLSVAGGNAYITEARTIAPGAKQTPQLETIDLETGASTIQQVNIGDDLGPVLAAGGRLWVAGANSTVVEGISLTGGPAVRLGTCRGVRAIAMALSYLLMPCTPASFAVVDTRSGAVTLDSGGAFPVDVTVAP